MAVNIDNISWAEKYRPKTIDEVILPTSLKKKVKSLIKNDNIPNMIFHSTSPGTGKTSLALAICNELGYDVLMINGSNEGRLIDTLRTKVTNFASSVSLEGNKKCVIFDEADYIPEETVQPALRNFMEEFDKLGVAFIFTANNVNRIIEPLRSRCSTIDFSFDKKDVSKLKLEIAKKSLDILKAENITIESDEILPTMIQKLFPDNRKLINELQFKTADGKLDSSALTNIADKSELVELITLLKGKNFKSIREWVALHPYIDLQTISSYLYNNMLKITKATTAPEFIIILADWSYKQSFMTDKELAITAMLVDLITQIELTE